MPSANIFESEEPKWRGLTGRWVVYMWSDGIQAQSLHNHPVLAIEACDSGSQIMFWPDGMTLEGAHGLWEKRQQGGEHVT